MILTKFAVKRPVSTTMVVAFFVFFGMMAYFKLPVNLMPNIKIPAVTVITNYFGATPDEIEREITNRIEKEIATIEGIKKLNSYSSSGMSLVVLEFNLKKNVDVALSQVKQKIDIVRPDFPKGAENPVVELYNINDAPVLYLVMQGDIDGAKLRELADETVSERLSRINGVSKISINGSSKREIQILPGQEMLYNNALNLEILRSSLENNGLSISGGAIDHKGRRVNVKTGDIFESLDDIRNTPVPSPYGLKPLNHLARVVDTVQTTTKASVYNDLRAKQSNKDIIILSIHKKSDANAVKVAKNIKEILPQLQQELPENAKLKMAFDTTDFIESSVDDALTNVILGILLTGFILWFFLHNIRVTIIVSITIPVSLIATFWAMQWFNASLNMMSLMSFSVAIGALVSNSIVVLENIVRLNREGMPIKEAAVKGTEQVMLAVIASTGTNLVVFLPIANMVSLTGAFFKEYALTISAATVFSLLFSFTITPMLASVLLGKHRKTSRLSALSKRFFDWLEVKYENGLKRLIARGRNPIILFSVMLIIFVLSMGLLTKIGFEFEPEVDDSNLEVKMELAPGASLNLTRNAFNQLDSILSRHDDLEFSMALLENNTGTAYIHLVKPDKRKLNTIEYAGLLTEELKQITVARCVVKAGVSDEAAAPLQFNISATDMNRLIEAEKQINAGINALPEVMNFESSYRKGNPVLHIHPDALKLTEAGISVFDLIMTVRTAINGEKASIYREQGKSYDIVVKYPASETVSINNIRQIPIVSELGVFTVGNLSSISFEDSPSEIRHAEKIRSVTFSGSPAAGYVQGDAKDAVDHYLQSLNLNNAIEVKWIGEIADMNESMTDMVITFMISILLMYMLLAPLKENFWHPFIIFTTVPMAMIGVFVLMYISGQTLNIMSLMAIITLLGLVVNDDILIHDYTDQLIRLHSMENREATLTAGRKKMKTVIMTSVAIIAGMLPNALGIGDAGKEFRTPMAIVTIGGMITSTILTLFLIPSLFYFIRKRQFNNKNQK